MISVSANWAIRDDLWFYHQPSNEPNCGRYHVTRLIVIVYALLEHVHGDAREDDG